MKTIAFALMQIVCAGQLSAANYYVDASIANSGDGLSWETAYKTINEVAWSGLKAGDIVWIKAGRYEEYVSIDTDGDQLLYITCNVSVTGNRVYFPEGTNLSQVSSDGSDYLYLYQSRKSNNGVFLINGKGSNYVETEGNFIDENGEPNDEMRLSAAIGRPIIYRGYTPNNGDEVLITGEGSGFYFEDADFNIFENFTIRNSSQSFNNQNGGKFNVIRNNRVESLLDMNGIQIGVSSEAFPNVYNIICNNLIFDPQVEGIYIGAGGQGPENNHTDFTHIIDNEIYTSLESKELENAIDLKEHNKGTVVEGNYIHDIKLMTSGNGAIDVRNGHDNVLIYGNTIQNIYANELYKPVFRTYATMETEIFNNVVFNDAPDPQSELFVWICKAEGNASVDFYNNTIHNLARGFWMENTAGIFRMHNNIFSYVQGEYLRQWEDNGTLSVKNNLFTSAHNWTPEGNATEEGSIISPDVYFTDAAQGNYRISAGSAAADAASLALFAPLDHDLIQRDTNPDIGAFEYGTSSNIVTSNHPENALMLYPNPAKSTLFYQLQMIQNLVYDIKIIDQQGRLRYRENRNDSSGKIVLPELSAGVYFLLINGEMRRFIIGSK